MRILSLILAVAGFASLAGEARGDEAVPPEVLAAIKKATVFVKVQVEDKPCSGSGFVVKADDGTAYIVTNHHVIDPKLVEIVAEWRSAPRTPTIPVPHGPYGRIGPRAPMPSIPSPPILTPRLVARTLKTSEVTVVFQSGTPESISVLEEAAQKDPNPGVRSGAARAIEAIKRRQ